MSDNQQNPTAARLPLTEAQLDVHVEQAILERASLGHLYDINTEDGDPVASMKPRAATSIWRAVRDAVAQAGWRIVK